MRNERNVRGGWPYWNTAGLVLLGLAGACLGVTNVDVVQRLTWGENIGWLNWRDPEDGAAGAHGHKTFLSGYVWGENVGYINLGDGTPEDGLGYVNADAADSGVNVDPPTGDLFGLAWGENIGWVQFDTRASLSVHGQQARLDYATNRLRGYAWGENIGWINLDLETHFVAFISPVCNDPFADTDGDGDVDQVDFGMVQRCLSSAGIPATTGCECFDRPTAGFPRGDNDVDGDDLDDFEDCASGPRVPTDAGCDD